ncbi:hypothetical protein SynA1825c_01143 [Synechococcus sp. A18-25c]|nr:hypothetical protein SynA1560_01153 [Synechococcus sp. A15-60]QNJ19452.1 hypothetical protein SynA1825c_01143 [Synechococcus sp. A18-25c]
MDCSQSVARDLALKRKQGLNLSLIPRWAVEVESATPTAFPYLKAKEVVEGQVLDEASS